MARAVLNQAAMALTYMLACLLAAGPAPGTDRARVAALLDDPGALARWLAARSPAVQAAGAQVGQAEAELAQSAALPNPELNLALGGLTPGARDPGDPTRHIGFGQTANFSVGLSETLELGKRGPREASARLRRDAAGEDLRATLAERIAAARQALGTVAYRRARQAVLGEDLATLERALALEKVRLDRGDLSGNDYRRLLLDAQAQQLELGTSRSELARSLAGCGASLAAPCDDEGLAEDALDRAAPLPEPLPTLEQALAQSPELRALGLQRESAEADAQLAAHRVIPDPTIGVSFSHDQYTLAGDLPDVLTVSLGLPLALFDTGRHDAERASARARELEATGRETAARARAEIEALLAERGELEQGLAAVGAEAVAGSAAVLETTRRSFDLGQVSLTDLLQVQRAHRELLLRMLDLRFELFSVRSSLRQVLGLDAELAAETAGGKS